MGLMLLSVDLNSNGMAQTTVCLPSMWETWLEFLLGGGPLWPLRSDPMIGALYPFPINKYFIKNLGDSIMTQGVKQTPVMLTSHKDASLHPKCFTASPAPR